MELEDNVEFIDLKGIGKIAFVDEVPFNLALEVLKMYESTGPLSMQDSAKLKLKAGKSDNYNYSFLTERGWLTRESLLYAKKSPVLLVRNSPLLDPLLARKATQSSMDGKYFFSDLSLYERYFKQAERDKNKKLEERRVLILPSRNSFSISEKENWGVLEWLIGDVARDYFSFVGRDSLDMELVDKNIIDRKHYSSGSVLTQLWLGGLESYPMFAGDQRGGFCNEHSAVCGRGYREFDVYSETGCIP